MTFTGNPTCDDCGKEYERGSSDDSGSCRDCVNGNIPGDPFYEYWNGGYAGESPVYRRDMIDSGRGAMLRD